MDVQEKITRKRVANFTPDEKALLTHLIKKWAIIESKLTDGKSVAKKRAAWDALTQEFSSNVNVHKRDIVTLKRAWDNMKALTRKFRARERGHLIKTGGGPPAPTPSIQQGALINMVEEAAPVIICEIENTFDSDGAILSNNNISGAHNVLQDNENVEMCEVEIDDELCVCEEVETVETPQKNVQDLKKVLSTNKIKNCGNSRRPADYIRREAVTRLRLIEYKKKMEMQILKTQLETESIKKETALIMLEKAKLELKAVKEQ